MTIKLKNSFSVQDYSKRAGEGLDVADEAHAIVPKYFKHFTTSKARIWEVAQTVVNPEEKTALILGAGACRDVPLAKIADIFQEVVIVDRDMASLCGAVEKLSEEQQRVVVRQEADLTGIAESLESILREVTQQELKSPRDFGNRVVDRLSSIKRKHYPYQELTPSFVCSSLVCAQLAPEINGYLTAVSLRQTDSLFSIDTSHAKVYENFLREIPFHHLEEMRNLAVAKDASVYFADNPFVYTSGKKEELYSNKTISDSRAQLFTIKNTWKWKWHVPRAVPEPQVFEVEAFQLSPKAASDGERVLQ